MTAIEQKKPTVRQNVFVVSAFALVFAFIAWSLLSPSRAINDSSVQSLKSDAFSPISKDSSFGDIADKCMALIKNNQRGHLTGAEQVQLGVRWTTCLSFISGFLEGYLAAHQAPAKVEFCIPPDVTTAQIVKTFLTAAAEHPEESDVDGAGELQGILVTAYPCKDTPPIEPLLGQPNHI